ncbi:MAG: hypothetical protein AB8B39_04145, partial [Prochlorococcus sp.]
GDDGNKTMRKINAVPIADYDPYIGGNDLDRRPLALELKGIAKSNQRAKCPADQRFRRDIRAARSTCTGNTSDLRPMDGMDLST